MTFYSLRVVCRECGGASLLGGGAEHDLTTWRRSTVQCTRCGAETSASDAEVVDLRTVPEMASENRGGPSVLV